MANEFHDIRDLETFPEHLKGGVIAIGNFDGVHKGHQTLILQAKKKARELNLPCGVLTFEPHPREYFQPEGDSFRLTCDAQRVELLEEICGIDFVVTQKFDAYFASLSPEDFVDFVLLKSLKAAHVVIGHDFCYGKERAGKADTLESYRTFETEIIAPLKNQAGTLYSSSQIRHDLRRSDIAAANALLGWNWYLQGKVIHGDKRGRELGYPTANVALGAYLEPALGVYATKVKLPGEDLWRPSVTNIGIRPMFQARKPLVETFIFDFDREIYDQVIKVMPVAFLRGEGKFDSLEALILQMDKDSADAKSILSK